MLPRDVEEVETVDERSEELADEDCDKDFEEGDEEFGFLPGNRSSISFRLSWAVFWLAQVGVSRKVGNRIILSRGKC